MARHASASASFSALIGDTLAGIVTPDHSHREVAAIAFTTPDGAGYGTDRKHVQPIATDTFHAEMLTVQGDYFPDYSVDALTRAWERMVSPSAAFADADYANV